MDLGALFDLEPHGPDTFMGAGPRYPWGGLYGGQIVAQALRAAAATVDDAMSPHSLRAYFIRRGDPSEPVRYEVDRIRNGRSFCTRRVVARQAVGAILNLEASFQLPEEADDLQTIMMPSGISPPGRIDSPIDSVMDDDSWTTSFERRSVPKGGRGDDPSDPPDPAGRASTWMRVTDPVADDPLVHRCWLAYMSDDLPTDSVRRALAQRDPGSRRGDDRDSSDDRDSGGARDSGDDGDAGAGWWSDVFAASLDHTIWFHRPLRVDEWHLYDMACHGYIGGRGLSIGHVFTADGLHAATIAQEVLLRRGRPPQ